MLEVLGRNSRRYSTSLAASEVVAKGDEYGNREGNTKCAKTLRNIIEGQSRSLAASAPTSRAAAIPSPNPSVNRVKVLYNFVIKNHNL